MKSSAFKSSTGGRHLSVRVKTARGRKVSSIKWLNRQLNDPYVADAQRLGYRSRAAFKLLELNEKFNFLKPGLRVLDLGAAPGGWSQVASALTKKANQVHSVVAVDLLPIEPILGVTCLQLDFLDSHSPPKVKESLGGEADVVLSDMAASSTGHPQTDHRRIMMLADSAFNFAQEILSEQGVFIAKVLQGGTEKNLLDKLKKHFVLVKHYKPPASRKDSAEMYVVAIGFRR